MDMMVYVMFVPHGRLSLNHSIPRRNHTVRHVLSLVVFFALVVAPPSASAGSACAMESGSPPGLELIEEAYNILSVLFVEPLAPPALLGPAAAAIRDEVASQPTAASVPEVVLPAESVGEWALFVDQYCALWKGRGEDLEAENVGYAAIRAMAAAANEGHTQFLTPQMYRDHLAWSTGEVRYEGIGARLRSSPLGVQHVFPGSPAEAAGLMFGDRILAVDGQPVGDMLATDAVLLVRGEAGTTVWLTIDRPGTEEPWDVPIVRGAIRIPTVESRKIGNIGYLRIEGFPAPALFGEVAAELASLEASGVEGLVLDLRSNSGGRLDVGTSVAGLFLPEGTPLYRQTTRRGQATTKTVATGLSWSKPLAVLVDDGTASMAELLAAAIQEQGLATVIGTTTAGSVAGSLVVPLSDGSALQVTTLRLDSGLGRVLNRVGVHPDVEVELTLADVQRGTDRPLDSAMNHLESLPRLRILVAGGPAPAPGGLSDEEALPTAA